MIQMTAKPNILVSVLLYILVHTCPICNATPTLHTYAYAYAIGDSAATDDSIIADNSPTAEPKLSNIPSTQTIDSDTQQPTLSGDTNQPNMAARDTAWVNASVMDSVRVNVAEGDTGKVETVGITPRPTYVALKNNLLYDAAATPNLQLEFRLAEHWTLMAGVGFNPFPRDDKKFPKWRHVLVELAPRYWFCGAFTRDFVSLNVGYSHYNVAGGTYPIGWMYKDVQTNRFQGDALLFGGSYGWMFPLTKHFSIELEGGVDGGVTWYDQFTCVHCGKQLAEKQKKWFAVPRLGVNLVVMLDDTKEDFEDRCDCQKLHVAPAQEETAVSEETAEETVLAVVPQQEDSVASGETTEEAETVEETDTAGEAVTADADEPREVAEPTLQQLREQIYAIEEQMAVQPSDSLWQEIDKIVAKQEAIAHKNQMSRLRDAILRPLPEFAPYDPNKRVETEPNCIYMHFDVDKTNVDRAYIHNDELMDSIVAVIREAKEDPTIEIKLIKIVGMASFDGPLEGNIRLGKSRAEALHDYLQERFHFDESMYRIYNGGECWQELRWYLEQESFPNKHEVMMTIDREPDVEIRELIIKNLDGGITYEYMRRHFQRYLRNLGTITVYYEEKK